MKVEHLVVPAPVAGGTQLVVMIDQRSDAVEDDSASHSEPAALAAAASTLPGSDSVTMTSVALHDGHFIRSDSIEIGNAAPRVQISVSTSSSCRRPQAPNRFQPFAPRLGAAHIEPAASLPNVAKILDIHENELGTYTSVWQGLAEQKISCYRPPPCADASPDICPGRRSSGSTG